MRMNIEVGSGGVVCKVNVHRTGMRRAAPPARFDTIACALFTSGL